MFCTVIICFFILNVLEFTYLALYLVISYSIFESSCNKEFKKVIMEVSMFKE
jgi:hypothetical protein